MPIATVTSKGQVTIPRVIREKLKIQPGDQLDFVLEDGDRVVVRPAARDIRELKGLLRRPGRSPVSVAEMNAVIRRRHGRR